jgi:Tol biopolymer transport system component
VSWLDWSVVTDLSEDGTTFLFHEAGEGSARYAAYLGRTDGSPAIRLGDGESLSLSPDGRQALVLRRATSRRLILLSTGPGEEREVATPGIEIDMVRWFPDGRTLLLYGRQSGRPARLFVAPLAGQVSPRALTPEGFDTFGMPVSADSRFVVSAGPDGRLWIFPTQGGEPRLVTGSEPGDRPMRWSRDGKVLYLLHGGDELPVDVFRLDLAKASRERWRKLLPLDPAGVMRLGSELLAADEKSYVYSYARVLSDLYLVDGLR